MLQLLIRLAPDQEDMSDEAKKIVYENTPGTEKLEKFVIALGDQLEKLTNNIIQ